MAIISRQSNKEQASTAACAAFRHVYRRAVDIGLDKLNPRQRWQFAYRHRKMLAKASAAVIDLADVCDAVIGTRDFLTCMEHIVAVSSVTDRAVCPAHTDSVVLFVYMPELSERERIRRSRPWFATTGPPPPKIEEPRRRFHTLAGLKSQSSGNWLPDEFNSAAKNIPPEFSGTVFCAPSGDQTLPPDDFADLIFARKLSRLAKFGERPLAEYWLHVGRERTLRTYLENLLDEFLDRLERLPPEAIEVTGTDRLVVPLHAVSREDEEGGE